MTLHQWANLPPWQSTNEPPWHCVTMALHQWAIMSLWYCTNEPPWHCTNDPPCHHATVAMYQWATMSPCHRGTSPTSNLGVSYIKDSWINTPTPECSWRFYVTISTIHYLFFNNCSHGRVTIELNTEPKVCIVVLVCRDDTLNIGLSIRVKRAHTLMISISNCIHHIFSTCILKVVCQWNEHVCF